MRGIQVWAILGSAAVLAACSSAKDRTEDFRHLSCAEIEREITRTRYLRDAARREQIAYDAAGTKAVGKQRSDAEFDGLIADVSRQDADADLRALGIVRHEKRCRG